MRLAKGNDNVLLTRQMIIIDYELHKLYIHCEKMNLFPSRIDTRKSPFPVPTAVSPNNIQ